MPGGRYSSRFMSLLCSCQGFPVSVNSLSLLIVQVVKVYMYVYYLYTMLLKMCILLQLADCVTATVKKVLDASDKTELQVINHGIFVWFYFVI